MNMKQYDWDRSHISVTGSWRIISYVYRYSRFKLNLSFTNIMNSMLGGYIKNHSL